ncbi:MAG: hypothetical protein HZB29_11130 [Nitrospinae bacterium]|nr:hypothetical protein [Nitrospinota bacterium]
MDDEFEELKNAIDRQRKYSPFFDWPDKRVKELGILRDLINAKELNGEFELRNPRWSDKDPPDCIAEDKLGALVAVEVTELVSQEAVEKCQSGSQVYCVWQLSDVIDKLNNIVTVKDGKLGEVRSSKSYSKVILVVHTDESTITYNDMGEGIRKMPPIPAKNIDEMYLLFSYDPADGGKYPYIRLQIRRCVQ